MFSKNLIQQNLRRFGIFLIAVCCFLLTSVAAQTPVATPASTPTNGETNNVTAPDVNFDKEPLFQDRRERPAPPSPSLARPGIENSRVLTLSLNEAVRMALENNNNIEVARNDVRIAEGTLLSLKGVYDPVLNFTPRFTNSVTPQTSTISGGGTSGKVRQTIYEADTSVTRQFGPGGGQYQFFFNNQRETTTALTSSLSPFYAANAGVTFTQPLWRNFRIDRYRHDIRVQRRRVAQSDADFRLRVIEIITQVQQAYWELVFSLRDQQNRVDNVNLAREQFRDVEGRVSEGNAAPLERTEVQTQLSAREAELITAITNVTVAENIFKVLVLKTSLSPQWSAPIVPTDPPPFDLQPLSVESAIADARQNRPELQRINLDQEINKIDLDYFRNQAKPRIDLISTLSTTGLAGSPTGIISGANGISGSTTANGSTTGTTANSTAANGQTSIISGDPNTNSSAFLLQQINQLRQSQGLTAVPVPTTTFPSDLNGSYGRSLQNLVNGNTRNIVVSVQIEIPFGNRTARGNLAVAKAQTDRLAATLRQQEQTVESDVRNAIQRLESARQTVLATRTGRRNAELQVAGERQLYVEGRSTTFLVFQRENDLANARNSELRAEADYNTALADLQRSTGTTLDAANVMINNAKSSDQ